METFRPHSEDRQNSTTLLLFYCTVLRTRLVYYRLSWILDEYDTKWHCITASIVCSLSCWYTAEREPTAILLTGSKRPSL
jgi:hypothetical protein